MESTYHSDVALDNPAFALDNPAFALDNPAFALDNPAFALGNKDIFGLYPQLILGGAILILRLQCHRVCQCPHSQFHGDKMAWLYL